MLNASVYAKDMNVNLNIGGQLFQVPISLLTQNSDFFDGCLDNRTWDGKKIVKINRSPVLFAEILDLLNGRFYKYPSEYVKQELDFYGIRINFPSTLQNKEEEYTFVQTQGTIGFGKEFSCIILKDIHSSKTINEICLLINFSDLKDYAKRVYYDRLQESGKIDSNFNKDQIKYSDYKLLYQDILDETVKDIIESVSIYGDTSFFYNKERIILETLLNKININHNDTYTIITVPIKLNHRDSDQKISVTFRGQKNKDEYNRSFSCSLYYKLS